jgi:hypothetical protein
MKRVKLLIRKMYAIEVPDDTTPEDYPELLSKHFAKNNTTSSVEFWDNVEIACSDCGVSMSLDEEKADGICVSCEGNRK